jgi:hypothetical protein
MPLLASFESPDNEMRAVIEDDDRVAYLYLWPVDEADIIDSPIAADVWLYNVAPAPTDRSHIKPGEAPLNLAGFAGDNADGPVTDPGDVEVRWVWEPAPVGWVVHLYLRGSYWARLAPGERPGRCILARRDGPMARRLDPATDPRAT